MAYLLIIIQCPLADDKQMTTDYPSSSVRGPRGQSPWNVTIVHTSSINHIAFVLMYMYGVIQIKLLFILIKKYDIYVKLISMT
jgi:hypothetical protein